jgi:hypothetical protein
VTCLATEENLGEAPSLNAKIRVETISGYQEFLGLETVCNDVAEAAGLDHPFPEHAWIRSWWECFGAESALHILVVKADDQLIAIAPLMLTPIRMWLFVFSGTFKGRLLHLIKFRFVPFLKWLGFLRLRSLTLQMTSHLPVAVDAKIQRNQ